jgi:hypothetical protein
MRSRPSSTSSAPPLNERPRTGDPAHRPGLERHLLIERKPVTAQVAERWVGSLRDAFPTGRIDISKLPHTVDLHATTSDADDEHVCALAITAAPTTLVTLDDDFNAAALAGHQVRVAKPDELLVPSCDEQPDALIAVLDRQARAWGNRPLGELLDAVARAGAPMLVKRARSAAGP